MRCLEIKTVCCLEIETMRCLKIETVRCLEIELARYVVSSIPVTTLLLGRAAATRCLCPLDLVMSK